MARCAPPRFLWVLLAATMLANPSRAADRPWLEVRTPHFVVVANTGEKTARDVGWQFEQVRHVFESLWPWGRRERGRPFVVIAVRDTSDVKALAPYYWEAGRDGTVGVAVSGPDKDYVLLEAGIALPDDLRTNPYFYAYWGYASRALQAALPGSPPLWFSRGLADLFGNTVVRGKDVQVGRLISHHLRELGGRTRIPLAELLSADRKSKYFVDESWRRTFDAQSWMLAHYLVFGEKGAHQPQLNRFFAMLREGRPPDISLREAFGDLAALETGFNYYVGREIYSYATIKSDLNVKAEGFAVRTLTPAAAAAVRAAFHAAMERPREVRALIAEARRTEPGSVLASEVEGLLLEEEDKREEASAAYGRAAEGGSENFYVYYRRASMMHRPNPPTETLSEMAKLLDQAVRLNPDHAWSQASLSRVLAQLEPGDRAIQAARQAVSLEPSVAAHRLALIQALWKGSREADARREVQAAQALATDEDARQHIQEWISFMNRAGAPATVEARPSPEAASGAPVPQGDWIPQLTQACDTGTTSACKALAVVHANRSTPESLARARALVDKACRDGEASACQLLKSLPK